MIVTRPILIFIYFVVAFSCSESFTTLFMFSSFEACNFFVVLIPFGFRVALVVTLSSSSIFHPKHSHLPLHHFWNQQQHYNCLLLLMFLFLKTMLVSLSFDPSWVMGTVAGFTTLSLSMYDLPRKLMSLIKQFLGLTCDRYQLGDYMQKPTLIPAVPQLINFTQFKLSWWVIMYIVSIILKCIHFQKSCWNGLESLIL